MRVATTMLRQSVLLTAEPLAMPRDAETNTHLFNLKNAVKCCFFRIGLTDIREKDISMGFSSWRPGEPNNLITRTVWSIRNKGNDFPCSVRRKFICQVSGVASNLREPEETMEDGTQLTNFTNQWGRVAQRQRVRLGIKRSRQPDYYHVGVSQNGEKADVGKHLEYFMLGPCVSRQPPRQEKDVFFCCPEPYSVIMSEEEQQSQAGDTSATPMRRPECYWLADADAAARIPNPMYASNAGTAPMQQPQSLQSRPGAAPNIPNPMYPSNAGATRMRQPLSYWRSLANAAAKMFNPMYAFSSANPPMDQPQTDYQARANDNENTPDATYANIPAADPPMDQPQTDYQARANNDENTSDATYAAIPDDPPIDPPIDQPRTDHQARTNDNENTPDATHATIPDGACPGGASGRRGVCSFLYARRSCLAAGIAVLLGLCAVGLAPLTFSNKQEISHLSRAIHQLATTVNALKRDQDDVRQLSASVDALGTELEKLKIAVEQLSQTKTCDSDKPQDCQDIFDNDETTPSGVYMVYPRDNLGGFYVFCDMDTDGGGWTLFQRRQDGRVDFYRGWADYKTGFPSNLNGEFWLGNYNLYRLAVQKVYQLRVDMEDAEGNTAYAAYDMFAISPESQNYKLHIGTYSGNSLKYHDGEPFSTKDRDNDESQSSCAQVHKGAWWYGNYHLSNLNGLYHLGTHEGNIDGVHWQYWKVNYSLKRTEMKLRPAP
ncbi:Fibrinogen C domain-containing protein 1 [Branchiostoma belcheri]|nr:Fibrinogen C domain-containing protein 1 [Branchiostoma belcheri]